MATADELLMMNSTEGEVTEEILVADLKTRVIAIPASISILGVEADDDVKRLQFRMPRYYCEFDLSTFDVRVNFQNARNKGDVYPVDDVNVTEDNYITFSWLVDRVAFQYAGDVKFSLCLKLYDDAGVVIKELNTTFATLPVLPGLETEKAVVEQNPSAFDQVMYRLYAVEAASGIGQNGYFTIVNVTENEEGVVFSLINQDGEVVANVKHGMDGTDGKDGYTPVKGVDYWTEADETEIKQELSDITHQRIHAWAPISQEVVLSCDGWSSNEQTVAVPGVTADNIVVVAPEPSSKNYKSYCEQNVRCISQSDGYLKFARTASIWSLSDYDKYFDLKVIVAIYYSANTMTDRELTVTDDDEGNVTIVV